jgi:hypothetical protein
MLKINRLEHVLIEKVTHNFPEHADRQASRFARLARSLRQCVHEALTTFPKIAAMA